MSRFEEGKIYRYVPNASMLVSNGGPGTEHSSIVEEVKRRGNKKVELVKLNWTSHSKSIVHYCQFVDDTRIYLITEECLKPLGGANKPGEFE